ncbi:hypothetical protein TWF718_009166 [Orbilia javanica]|uniref:Uncharacterized protein n=1 Tax=Orbilia javanica TaxID=47235 RepID=A0AAN8RCE0_9PEZI
MSVESLRNKAQEYWVANFDDGPYSNLIQAQYLVGKSGRTWEQILQSPRTLRTLITADDLSNDSSSTFKHTWAAAAGRCTAFCLRIVRKLQEYDSPSFDFKIYDLRGHRVARCAKTGILIDSSSAVGVLVLRDGADWTMLEEEVNHPKWKWDGSESKFKTDAQGLKTSADALSFQAAMTQCLTEIRDKFEPLCLFRSFSGGRAHFHAMIKWVPSSKQLVLLESLETKVKTTIKFDKDGTTETEKECIQFVEQFITSHGGLEGDKQWKFGQPNYRAKDIHETIWTTAKKIWGLPRIVT